MKKDFNSWTQAKLKINDLNKSPFFHEREIWFCKLGINIGYEQDGSKNNFWRPVIILRKFNNDIFWALPLTRSIKTSAYYFIFNFDNSTLSCALLTQMRLIDAKRLDYKIGSISEKDFKSLIKKFKELLP